MFALFLSSSDTPRGRRGRGATVAEGLKEGRRGRGMLEETRATEGMLEGRQGREEGRKE